MKKFVKENVKMFIAFVGVMKMVSEIERFLLK